MRPLAAHCRRDLGKLLLAAKREADALGAFERAARIFDDLDLPLFRDETRSLLAQLESTTA